MTKITETDLYCILMEQSEFQVEYNDEEKTLSYEDIFDIIHNKKIEYIDFMEHDSVFIRFENDESLFIEL